ncbi:hypothetical protein IscW_ISCW010617 [Ixodes scapularis]|uniref:Uncharacterized protein n=1 Tax=Ixodes scapularis TaxID=6945 RepID=B7Q567_IXOSC|nr:hypothetical protein IscW_ISCW010617 [Ixodes scapularis]|eukprot:XP_002401533.1 hypothetical protein IscW_ISCW010617 [Ixodes scapularis]
MEHREQCEKKKLACEYCKLELKGDNEAPRKEMQEHEKDPQNALLNQVIFVSIRSFSVVCLV